MKQDLLHRQRISKTLGGNIERKQKVIRLREQGKTYPEIGRIMGFSKQRAFQIVNKKGLYKDLSPEQKKRIYEKRKKNQFEYNRKWCRRNPDKVLEYVNRWKAKNPDKALQHIRNYYKKHRKEILAKQHKRYIEDEDFRLAKIEREKERYRKKNEL